MRRKITSLFSDKCFVSDQEVKQFIKDALQLEAASVEINRPRTALFRGITFEDTVSNECREEYFSLVQYFLKVHGFTQVQLADCSYNTEWTQLCANAGIGLDIID